MTEWNRQIKDLDFRALILAFFEETVEFPGLGWVPKVAIKFCDKKSRDKDLSHNMFRRF